MPKIAGLLETALYTDDKERAVRFYEGVLGLSVMQSDKRLTAFDTGRGGVLLVFQRGQSRRDAPTPGGVIPGHDGEGPLHMAFAVAAEDYDGWRRRLEEHGVAVRSEVSWPRGGRSLYFDDPDGHVVELATPGLWPNY